MPETIYTGDEGIITKQVNMEDYNYKYLFIIKNKDKTKLELQYTYSNHTDFQIKKNNNTDYEKYMWAFKKIFDTKEYQIAFANVVFWNNKYPSLYNILFKVFSFSEDEIEKLVDRCPHILPHIDIAIPEDVLLKIIGNDVENIKYIKNPTDKMIDAVCNKNAYFLRYIDEISEKNQLMIINKNPVYAKYIKNPTENIQLKLVKLDGYYFNLLKNPTENVRKEFEKQVRAGNYNKKMSEQEYAKALINAKNVYERIMIEFMYKNNMSLNPKDFVIDHSNQYIK